MNASLIRVRVRARHEEASAVVSFELEPVAAAALPGFDAGAHIDVHLTGPGLVRQYSLCNAPSARPGHYLIGVLREPASRGGSQWLCDRLQAGSELNISAPRNHFGLVPGATRTLLLAGGIGVTPLLAMAEALHAAGQPFALHYCVRSVASAAFLQRLATRPWVQHLHLHCDDGPAVQAFDVAWLLKQPQSGQHLYTCGPAGFISHVLQTADAQGWPPSQVHREFFAAPQDQASGAREPDQPFAVRIASTGQEFIVPAGQAVTDVLAEHGIAIDISCGAGVCGTCQTGVLEGLPDHRDAFLTTEEKARNDCLMACCSRARSSLLVLDL
jgi:vanillate O-demethylase ferredoxin subunit